MLLISEKYKEQQKKYEAVYAAHRDEIPYTIYFATLQGHIDELKEVVNEKKHKDKAAWSFENALDLPPEFPQWNFGVNAVNAPENSPYVVKKDCQHYADRILDILDKHPDIEYLGIGTDNDIEGSCLASAFISTLPTKYQQLPRLRLFIDDTSAKTILAGLKNMHREDETLADGKTTYATFNDSGILRNQINFVMGRSLTRAVTVKAHSSQAVRLGYVKAPIIQLVTHRYLNYINFKPTNYYQVAAEIQHPHGKFAANLVDQKLHVKRFQDQQIAQQLVDNLSHQSKIIGKEEKPDIVKAPQFYKKTELQATLYKRYGMPLDVSDKLLEKLYNEDEILSYPRTDSVVIKAAQTDTFPQWLEICEQIPSLKKYALQAEQLHRYDQVAHDKRFVNDKKVNIHPALTLSANSQKEFIWDNFTQDEQHIIYEIALSCLLPFLPPKEVVHTTIKMSVPQHDDLLWLTKGTTVTNPGFSVLLHSRVTDDAQKDALPPVQVNDDVIAKPEITSHQTKPEPLYTIPSLMTNLGTLSNLDEILPAKQRKLLQDFGQGIGTSATRQNIILDLLKNNTLVETTKKQGKLPAKRIIPSESGLKIAKFLDELGIMQLKNVVQFELDLTAVQKGELTPQTFQQKYFQQTRDEIQKVQDGQLSDINLAPAATVIGKCPQCGGQVLQKKQGYICENFSRHKNDAGEYVYDGCSFIVGKRAFKAKRNLPQSAIKQILAGKQTAPITFIAKNNKEYQGCLYWDKHLKKLQITFPDQESTVLGTCPLCGADVLAKTHGMMCSANKIHKNEQGQWVPEGCSFMVSRTAYRMQGKGLTNKELSQLLNGEATGEHKFKGKKTFTARLKWDKEQQKLVPLFKQPDEIGTCPQCGHTVRLYEKYAACEQRHPHEGETPCTFMMNRQPYHLKRKLTISEMQQALDGKVLSAKKFHSATKDRDFTADLQLEPVKDAAAGQSAYDWQLKFNDAPKVQALKISCPQCHQKKLKENSKCYWCDQCGFKLWKNAYNNVGGIKPAEVAALANGGSFHHQCVGRSGKTYDARFHWENGDLKMTFD